MKKFGSLLAGIFVLTLVFSFTTGIGTVYAAPPTEWTKSNVKGTFQLTRITDGKVQVLSLSTTATVTGFTDPTTGDPTTGTVTVPSGLIGTPTDTCYLAIAGEITFGKTEITPVYICIDEVVPVILEAANGKSKTGYVFGTGDFWTDSETGFISFEGKWTETDVGGLPTSITLSAGKMVGAAGVATESESNIISTATLPTVKFSSP